MKTSTTLRRGARLAVATALVAFPGSAALAETHAQDDQTTQQMERSDTQPRESGTTQTRKPMEQTSDAVQQKQAEQQAAEAAGQQPMAAPGDTRQPGAMGAQPETAGAQQAAGPPVEISAGQLAANPAEYFGRNVIVEAEVEEVFSPNVFTLDEDRAFAGPDVLVLAETGTGDAADGDDVRIQGIVHQFVRAELERDYDWFQMSPEHDVTFKTRPVIVATSIAPAGAERDEQTREPAVD